MLERKVGDLALSDEIAVVAAANPPEHAADGWDLAPPLANRFCHLDWPLDVNTWVDGMTSGFGHLADPPIVDAARLSSARIRARSAIAAYIRSRPGHLYALPENGTMAGRAWPSPRSWTMAAELRAHAELAGVSPAVWQLLLVGAVGPAAAMEHLAWLAEGELPDPEQVLRDPDSLVLPPRADRVYATLSAIAAAVVADNSPPRWEAAWRAVARASDIGHADIAVAIVRTLVRHRPPGARPPSEVLLAMAPVLREAGLFDRLDA